MELGAVGPHAVHDDGKPACESNLRDLYAASLRQPHGPRPQAGPGAVVEENVGCLVQHSADHLVAAAADATIEVSLSGAIASRRQAKLRADVL